MEDQKNHENRDEEVAGGSNRSFGFVFAVVFLIVALWPLFKRGEPVYVWAVVLSLLFGTVAMVIPAWLSPFNRLWTRFGILLSRIVNPIIMAGIFFLAVTPTGWIMRLLGKDPLRLEWQKDQSSYWIPRDPPGPDPESLSNQF